MNATNEIPVRSLWTCKRTGRQIIVTRVTDEWIDCLDTGSMGSGGLRRSLLEEQYVMASETCRINASPH